MSSINLAAWADVKAARRGCLADRRIIEGKRRRDVGYEIVLFVFRIKNVVAVLLSNGHRKLARKSGPNFAWKQQIKKYSGKNPAITPNL